ncbi:toll-like receptor 7 isoform X2 [Patella vulgata]|uniref:toll-like receptor 7 isoform X2 n=1 Tax=Patella vulgata TaxID=6465 RepID=UPI0024A8DDEA|nr:toll-like receptor 7 isoform X2 [Patella vulgata]XP_055959414.1 toll-like receptor 7 isoform X2 [Patella vulgata]
MERPQVRDNLEYLDISAQSIANPLDDKSNFEDLEHNDRHHTYPFVLPSKLKYFYFGGINRIGFVTNLIITGGTNIVALNMSYNFAVFSDTNITGIMNLQILDLSGNSCFYIAQSFFDRVPNLTQLRLSNTHLNVDAFFNIGKRLLQPLSKLERLDLSKNALGILPRDIFQGLSNLKEVWLSYNNLITIPALSGLPRLQQIYLSKNSIVTIDEDTRKTLDELTLNGHKLHLSISGNMLSCNCESLSLLQWLNQTHVNLDGGDYPCISFQGIKTTTGIVTRRFHSLYLHCYSYLWLTIAVTGMSVLVIALLVSFVFVKNKLKIKLILLRMIGRYVKAKKREEFLYDVCVLYADDVYQWVCHTLRDELEVRRGLKLYLRDRDEALGADKPTELYNTMESSWKVFLILTPGFLASDFSSSTMAMCLSFITLTTPNRLNLILDVNLNIPTNIDYFLESVNEENIYRYDINHMDANNPHFWNKIYHGITTVDNK